MKKLTESHFVVCTGKLNCIWRGMFKIRAVLPDEVYDEICLGTVLFDSYIPYILRVIVANVKCCVHAEEMFAVAVLDKKKISMLVRYV